MPHTYAKQATEPHRPVHTAEYRKCGQCKHLIGRNPIVDPVHAVSGWCVCGAAIPAFTYRCDECATKVRIAREMAKQDRLANAVYEPVAAVLEAPEGKRRDHADPYEGDPERKRRFNEAVAYIREYRGNWGFILDLRAHRTWGTKWYRLSDRQVEVVLGAKAREGRVIQIQVPKNVDLNRLPFGRTYAAVENDEGTLTFLIFDRPKADNKWAGWVFVKQQQGPQEVRIGAQRPGLGYVGQWSSLIERVLDDIPAAVIRYGRELGVCGMCALPLTNAESREAGIGPICRTRIEA